MRRPLIVLPLASLLLAAVVIPVSCGDGRPRRPSSSAEVVPQGADALNALVASYDLAADRPQRFMVGLVTNDQQLVSFGEARLSFAYLGEGQGAPPPEPGPEAIAAWQPIPGQDLTEVPDAPRVVSGSEGTGVYAARDVTFARPGFWQVDVAVEVDGQTKRAEAAFQVHPEPVIVAPGDAAPPSENHLPGAQGVPVKAVDSRAEPDGTVPDPELHQLTVAEALASGKPTMVVVSTPVYCVSRFCGPITDAVQELARRHGGAMNFVHIEVWKDFEAKILNEAAADWIYPPGAEDAVEPWVWVVGADGVVTERFDNVASEAELAAAVEAAIGT
ncbi:MAG: hypothetical protein M3N37_02950 [Actinomycetota bacterium]|nr:hypothetical protein [Actinomycetota bacterium]